MLSSKGVIQGYCAVAAVDQKHQIVVHAQAYGEGQEHGLLIPMLEGTRASFRALRLRQDVLAGVTVLADAGYCSEANAQYLSEQHIDGYLADPQFRKRDPRFLEAERHKPTRAGEPFAKPKRALRFQTQDFKFAEDLSHCVCPAGKRLYRNGRHHDLQGYEAIRFRGNKRDCGSCALRTQCLRHPQRTVERQVALFIGRAKGKAETHCADEAQDRQRPWPAPLQPPSRDRGAGVCQPAQHPPAEPIQPPRAAQGDYPVAALLSGAQHWKSAPVCEDRYRVETQVLESFEMIDSRKDLCSASGSTDSRPKSTFQTSPLTHRSGNRVFLQARWAAQATPFKTIGDLGHGRTKAAGAMDPSQRDWNGTWILGVYSDANVPGLRTRFQPSLVE
jgi:hypothetical protein